MNATGWIDYRSDSVTQPTPAMRKAMAEAEVGYDVFHDDPTVLKLEHLACEMTGKEDCLFVPSGTMGNELAVYTATRRGDEIIMSSDSHIHASEVGAAAVISSVSCRTVVRPDSILRAEDVEKSIRDDENIHSPHTSMVCMENALGRGTVVTPAQMQEVYEAAHRHGLFVHTDGARVFNACTALGCDVKEIACNTDSLAIHLSKGLCAPVGCLLLGPADFIARARKNRQLLGGGMSQTGVLAAPGIIALTEMPAVLAEDHENAKRLAEGLANIPGITVDFSRRDINMVFTVIDKTPEELAALAATLLENGIKTSIGKSKKVRFVLHHDISREDVEKTLRLMAR